MSALSTKISVLSALARRPLCRVPSLAVTSTRPVSGRPAFVQKLYDKLDALPRSIDEEGKVGANLPFSIENPRLLALKIILFIGIAFNLPFYIIYRQMKSAKGD
uniref:Cytochrome c oxidase polypeptide VIIc n=1 Tax=Mesocestoides corti TaxID=53468 RepID=A0A5K3EQD1_MESCO